MPLSKEDFAKVFAGVSGRLVEELPAAFEMPPHAVRWVQEVRRPPARPPARQA